MGQFGDRSWLLGDTNSDLLHAFTKKTAKNWLHNHANLHAKNSVLIYWAAMPGHLDTAQTWRYVAPMFSLFRVCGFDR